MVDEVVVFASVESYGICRRFKLISREIEGQ